MQVVPFNNLEELAPYADAWDRLSAGVPFRSWTWLSTWWRHYGPEAPEPGHKELAVLAVFDDGDMLVGLAPWYWEMHLTQGGALKMLGSGEVCSDYLTVLSSRGHETDVALALAEFLIVENSHSPGGNLVWDLLELTGVDYQDRPVQRLGDELSVLGCTLHMRSTINCWRIDLPTRWEAYTKTLSKKFCSEVERFERKYFASGKAVMHAVDGLDRLPWALDLLIDLHQRRWHSLGQRGCYASPRFSAFIRDVAAPMMRQGQLQILWLEIDGRPAAVEFQLVGGGGIYAYQSGIHPEMAKFHPGKLSNMASIRRAIEQGFRSFDFLRGDEPYKAHFRATPRPSLEVRIVPHRFTPQWRHRLWRAGVSVKRILRQAHLVR
ncbi:MAG: GNAT family N-acetyltransferase [Pirellulales bacterium]|nr:GNAT family N-acetyltransferase [Pirellulales bacterium]